MNGVDHNVIKLKLFSFSLRDKAKNWFHNLMSGLIDTWGALVEVFLTIFFSTSVDFLVQSDNHTISTRRPRDTI